MSGRRATSPRELPGEAPSTAASGSRVVCLLLGGAEGDAWLGFADGSVERLLAGTQGTAPDSADAASSAEPAASEADEHLQKIKVAGVGPSGLVLGLPARWVFALRLPPIPASARKLLRNRRLGQATALRFQAEPLLPVDAESLAVAYRSTPLPSAAAGTPSDGSDRERSGGVFLIATDADRAGGEVAALESQGISVAAVCATSLLAASEGSDRGGVDDASVTTLRRARRLERVELVRREPTAWTLGLDAAAEGVPFDESTIGEEETARRAVAAVLRLRRRDRFPLDLAAGPLGVREVATGAVLRRGFFARGRGRELRRPLAAVAVAASLLLATSLVALQVRVHDAHAAAAASDRAARAAFRSAFPDQSVPAALLSRLRSEARAAGVLAGSGGVPAVAAIARPSALVGLDQALAAIPGDLRIELDEIRVEPERILLEGRVRAPGDADRLATSLRAAGLSTRPPRTQALPAGRGVGFTLQADRASEGSAGDGAGP